MASKSAEKLIILNDVGRGLLARAFNLNDPQFVRPQSLNEELKKVCQKLEKAFPDHPNDLNKVPGMNVFQNRAQEIADNLQDYYLTFLDVMNFGDSAFSLLKEIAQTFREFRYEVNRDLMTHFMDLLVTFVRVHILIQDASEKHLMLTVYAKAHHCTHGNSEPNFLRIARFVTEYADPLAKLQDLCSSLASCVGDTLTHLQMQSFKWTENIIVDRRMFSVLDDTSSLGSDKHFEDHVELLYMQKINHWILFGFLVCPRAFNLAESDSTVTAVSMVVEALRKSFLLPIYRDKVLDVHLAYDTLFDKFKYEKFKLSKYHKEIKAVWKEPHITGESHMRLRTYMRMTLHTLYHLFLEYPGLLADDAGASSSPTAA